MNRIGLSPYKVLSVAALLCGLSLFTSAWLAMHQPWLGLALRASDGPVGMLVDNVQLHSPSELILTRGDNILSLQVVTGAPVEVQSSDLVEDPDIFPTFGAYRVFLDRQAKFAEILREPVVQLNLEDGRQVRVQPASVRPLAALPLQFWLLNGIGMLVFMIGSGVLSARLKSTPARLFFATGFGLLVCTLPVAVIVTREIALEPGFMLAMRALYHLGNNIFTVFGLALLYTYPKRLSSFPLPVLMALLVSFFWLNEQFEWTDFPGHTIFLQVIIYYLIGAVVACAQWRLSRGDPVSRAALKWLLLSFMGSVSIGLIIYFLQVLVFERTFAGISTGLGAVAMMYIGMGLGILKYRLFDIDRWWFSIWAWFLTGGAILFLDGLLATTVFSGKTVPLVLALFLIGWVYFPARQWIWGRVYPTSAKSLELSLSAIVAGIVARERVGGVAWERVLKEIFKPLSFEKRSDQILAPGLEKHGEILLVPDFGGKGTIQLGFADNGVRLFSRADVKLAGEIHKIARQVEERLAAYNLGVDEERERIMCDLHDDIGGRLLSLIHSTTNHKETQLAREALRALRDIIYSIDQKDSTSLDEALSVWRRELYDRCENIGIALHWEVGSLESNLQLTPRQLVNISRVLFEASSNAFTHAKTELLWVAWKIKGQQLTGFIRNDGVQQQESALRYGKGIINMERRITDLGGDCSHQMFPREGIFEVRLSLPLTPGQDPEG